MSELHQRIGAVVESVIQPDELDWLNITESPGLVQVALSARGEEYQIPVSGAGLDDAGQFEHFVDGLETFIAESRFAWGQQRIVPLHLYSVER